MAVNGEPAGWLRIGRDLAAQVKAARRMCGNASQEVCMGGSSCQVAVTSRVFTQVTKSATGIVWMVRKSAFVNPNLVQKDLKNRRVMKAIRLRCTLVATRGGLADYSQLLSICNSLFETGRSQLKKPLPQPRQHALSVASSSEDMGPLQ
jgi:hypothetical protein